MKKNPVKQIKFILLHFLIICFVNSSCLLPIYANAIVPNNTLPIHNVIVDQAGNGVPIVNINDPNQSGVSRNQFLDFNVGTNGVILNNSQERVSTTLGGFIEANPNLHHSADTIINEVTGTSLSNIHGTTEIAGRPADYILANPNGISVNGGSFINAHKVTLTTGKVGLDPSGYLDNLMVEKGVIEFLGREINVKNLDYFDVISKVAKINAQIHAGSDLKIVTGNNKYNTKRRQVTEVKSNINSESGLAIDSTMVGGLYAGKITIIANDKGAGVNLPEIKAGHGEIQITADGNIVHTDVSSPQSLRIESKTGSISVKDNKRVRSNGNVEYKSNTEITVGNKSEIIGANDVVIDAKTGSVTNLGKILSHGNGQVKIDSVGLTNEGSIYAKLGFVNIDSKIGSVINKGGVISDSIAGIKIVGRELKNEGGIYAKSGEINIEQASLVNQGKIFSAKGVNLKSGEGLDNRGTMVTGAIDLALNGAFINAPFSKLESKSTFRIKADNFDNKGLLLSKDILDIASNREVYNDGTIEASGNEINIISHFAFINNIGSINLKNAGDIKLTSIGLLNNGTIDNAFGSVIIDAKIAKLDNTGNIISRLNKDIKIDSIGFSNEGVISSAGSVNIDAGNGFFTNKGGVVSGSSDGIKIDSIGLLNRPEGVINAKGKVVINAKTGILTNEGNIISNAEDGMKISSTSIVNKNIIKTEVGFLDLNAGNGSITNEGGIIGNTGINLVSGTRFTNDQNGYLITDGKIVTTSNEFENKGFLIGYDELILNATSSFVNSGKINSQNNKFTVKVTAGFMTNSDVISALLASTINSKTYITNQGVVFADGLEIISTNESINNSGGFLSSGNLILKAKDGNFINAMSGVICTDSNLRIDAENKFENKGNITALQNAKINANTDIVNSGKILASGLKLISTSGYLGNSGTVDSSDKLIITIAKNIENANGVIKSAQKLNLTSLDGDLKNINGTIDSGEDLLFNVSGLLENKGDIIADGKFEIVSFKGKFDNDGLIDIGKTISIKGDGDFENIKDVKSYEELTFDIKGNVVNDGVVDAANLVISNNVSNFINNKKIKSANQINMEVSGDINNTGSIKAAKKINFDGMKFTNTGKVKGEKFLTIKAADEFYNSGEIKADKGIKLDISGAFTNGAQGRILSVETVTLDLKNATNFGHIEAARNLIVNADKLENTGYLIGSQKNNITTKFEFINKRNGHVEASLGALTIKTDDILKNKGAILSGSATNIRAKSDITNVGIIQSANFLSITSTAGELENTGTINGKDKISLVSEGSFKNSGIITATSAAKLTSKNKFNNTGVINSKLTLNITSKDNDIENKDGLITSEGDLTIVAEKGKFINEFTNNLLKDKFISSLKEAVIIKAQLGIENIRGHIEAAKNMVLESGAGGFKNYGNILSNSATTLNFKEEFVNSGFLQSKNALTLTKAKSLDNSGAISTSGALDFNIDHDVKNSGIIQSAQAVKLIAAQGKVTNEKIISSYGAATINALGDIINDEMGYIGAKNILNVTTRGKIHNKAKSSIISEKNSINLTANLGVINDESTISSNQNLTITSANGEITNNPLSKIVTTKGLVLTGRAIMNKAQLESGQKLTVTTTNGDFKNEGQNAKAISFDALDLTIVGDILNSSGRVEAAGDLTVKNTKAITNTGEFISGTKLQIEKADNFINSGHMQGQNLLKLGIINRLDNQERGVLLSGDTLSIKAGTNITNSGNIQARKGTITSKNAGIDNVGVLFFKNGSLDLVVKNVIDNKTGGGIIANTLNLSADSDIKNNDQIDVVAVITVTKAQNFTNNSLIKFGELKVTTSNSFTNNASLDGGVLTVNAPSFSNPGSMKLTGALNIASNSFTSANLLSSGGGSLNITGAFINANSLDFGQSDITITASSIDNRGTFKSRNFTGGSASSFTNSGTIFARNNATLIAPISINNSGFIIAANDVALKSNGTIESNRGIFGRNSVQIGGINNNTAAISLVNKGDIKSNGSVIAKANAINNTNTGLFAGQNALNLTGALTHSGKIISQGSVNIGTNGTDFTNNGKITSTNGNVTINSRSFNNFSGSKVEAAGTLKIDSSGAIENNHLLYGGQVELKGQNSSITNKGRIIAMNSMELTSAGDIKNVSGTQNAGEISVVGYGKMVISGNSIFNNVQLTNDKYEPLHKIDFEKVIHPNRQYHHESGSRKERYGGDKQVYNGTWVGVNFNVNGMDPTTIEHNIPDPNRFRGGRYPEGKTLTRTIMDKYTYKKTIDKPSSISPIIASSGEVVIQAKGAINNIGGVIQSKGNINLNGKGLSNYNLNDQTVEVVTRTLHYFHRIHAGKSWYLTNEFTAIDPKIDFYEKPAITSVIQSGSSITGTLAGAVTNGSSQSGGNKIVANVSNSNIVLEQANYTLTQNVQDVNLNPLQARQINASNSQGLSQNNIITSALPPLNLPTPSSTPPTSINLALSNDIASKAGKVSMDAGSFSQMVRNLTRSYQSEKRAPIDRNSLPQIRDVQVIKNAPTYDVPLPQPSLQNSSTSSNDNSFSDEGVFAAIVDPEIKSVLEGYNWDLPKAPPPYYIKETSPIFTDLGKYFSTDNFIKRMPNYNPKKEVIHYGDPLKQMELIRHQMVQLTGLMSHAEGLDSVSEMRNLYESGIKIGTDLQLTPGITLTKELVNNLQENIVWPELVNLGGKEVMVPKLYLARKNTTSKPLGGILAPKIDIKAQSIYNNGNIVGQSVLLQSQGDIINEGGKILSGDSLSLISGLDINNTQGGSIISKGSGYMQGRNINNITSTTKDGYYSNYWIESGPQSSIKVAKMLGLTTTGNIINTGSTMKVGSLDMDIGGSLINESIETGHKIDNSWNNGYYRKRSVVYKPGEIEVKNDLNGIIEGNFGLIGSKLKVGGSSTLLVGGDTLMESQVNSRSMESYSVHKSRNAVGGTNKSTDSSSSHHEILVASGLEVGSKSILFNKGNQTFVGAKLTGGEGIDLKSSSSKFLGLNLTQHDSSSSSSKGMVWQSSENSGHTDSYFHGTEVVGDLRVESDHVEVEYKKPKTTLRKDRLLSRAIGDGMVISEGTTSENLMNLPQGLRSFAMNHKGNITLTAIYEKHESWDESQEGLTPEAGMIVGLGASLATMWVGGIGVFAPAGTSTTLAGTLHTTLVTGLASRGAVSMINNGFDPFKVTKDLTSKESLKSLGTGMMISGVTFGITEATGLGQVGSGMKPMERFRAMGERGLINTGVRSVVSGQKLEQVFKQELGSTMLAMGQSVLGDIGEKLSKPSLQGTGDGVTNGSSFWHEGGIGKTMMHGALGGVYSQVATGKFGTGFLGGSMGEMLAPITQSPQVTSLISSGVMFGLGGNTQNIGTVGNVSQGVVENNRRLHQSELTVLKELQKGKSPEEQKRLELAAKYLVAADKGLSESDVNKPLLSAETKEGAKYVTEQKMLREAAALKASKAEDQFDQRLFDYSKRDKIGDYVSRQEKSIYKVGQGTQALMGAVGTVSFGVGAVGFEGATIGVGTPGALVLGGMSAASYYHTKNSVDNVLAPYEHQEGAKVQQSFKTGNDSSFVGEKTTELAIDTATAVGVGKMLKYAPVVETLATSKLEKIGKGVKTTPMKAENGGKLPGNGVEVGGVLEKPVATNAPRKYDNFETTNWTAPKGTKQTYKVYQRQDIDWNLVRTEGPREFVGITNKEAAMQGVPPQLHEGSIVRLHHNGQRSTGPLVEISEKTHRKHQKVLHGQFGINKKNPEYPVKHDHKWKSDVEEYWRWRIKNDKP